MMGRLQIAVRSPKSTLTLFTCKVFFRILKTSLFKRFFAPFLLKFKHLDLYLERYFYANYELNARLSVYNYTEIDY